LILSLLPKPGATVKYALITVAGIVLLAGGAVLWIRRKALAGSGPEHHEDEKAPGSPVVVGAGIAALEVFTAFPYFAAIALIVGSSASDAGKLFLLALYCVVYAAPLFGYRGRVRRDGQPRRGHVAAHDRLAVDPLAGIRRTARRDHRDRPYGVWGRATQLDLGPSLRQHDPRAALRTRRRRTRAGRVRGASG
jgi:hypothetical protein